MTINEAIAAIETAAAKAKPFALIQYAVTYARQMRHLEGNALHVQALYTLNNLTAWRGEEARKVKAFLKTL